MRIRSPSIAVAFLLVAGGCAHEPAVLYGSYTIVGEAGAVTAAPPATLEIARPDRYTFCQAGRCFAGKFKLLRVPDAANGRITFVGPQVEAYVLSVSAAAYGLSAIDRQRGAQGSIDLDYSTGQTGVEIPLGVGDIAFVKQ